METLVGVASLRFILLVVLLSIPVHSLSDHDYVKSNSRKKLMVLMLDGFRWDYLDFIPSHLGGFDEFVENGVRAKYVEGVFPSLSYPSWTTLSTGLYPESHGILGNYFYSRELNDTFELHAPNRAAYWWDRAEPIWTTAVKHGLRVATILWSRSDVPIDGKLPQAAQGYTATPTVAAVENSLNKCLEYLVEGYDLVMVYGEHIDNVGHNAGPDSLELQKALVDVGEVLHQFFLRLNEKQLRSEVDILLVSDHGMTDVMASQFIPIQRYLNYDDLEYAMDQGALLHIYTKAGRQEQVFQQLAGVEGLAVYRNHEIPVHYHFRDNPNVPDVLVVTEPGFVILGSHAANQIPDAWLPYQVVGIHGYDVTKLDDMRTVFMATGPSFLKKTLVEAINLTDIYTLYCHLLDIPARPNNGSWDNMRAFLKPPEHDVPANKAVTNHRATAALSLVLVFALNPGRLGN